MKKNESVQDCLNHSETHPNGLSRQDLKTFRKLAKTMAVKSRMSTIWTSNGSAAENLKDFNYSIRQLTEAIDNILIFCGISIAEDQFKEHVTTLTNDNK